MVSFKFSWMAARIFHLVVLSWLIVWISCTTAKVRSISQQHHYLYLTLNARLPFRKATNENRRVPWCDRMAENWMENVMLVRPTLAQAVSRPPEEKRLEWRLQATELNHLYQSRINSPSRWPTYEDSRDTSLPPKTAGEYNQSIAAGLCPVLPLPA